MSLLFESRGNAKLQIMKDQWDPERFHVLQMQIFPTNVKAANSTVIEVGFEGELLMDYPYYKIALPTSNAEPCTVDLLQIYGYALNNCVANLHLRFPSPGVYWVADIRLFGV